MSDKEQFQHALEKLLIVSKRNLGYPFLWISQNKNLIEKNVDTINKNLNSPLVYTIYINFLILKNDLFPASHYIFLFEQKYPNNLYGHILKAIYFTKIENNRLAYNELLIVLNKNKNSYYIWQLILNCCVEMQWYNNGITLCDIALNNFNWDIDTKLNLLEFKAYFLHLNFHFKESIQIRKEEISILMKNSVYRPNNRNNNFDISLAFTSLIDILKLLESEGLKPFPTAGTLLGWHRNNEILSYDKDLDIAISPYDDIELVKVIIEKNPRYKLIKNIPYFTTYFSVLDKQTNCTIDILKYWKNKEHFEYGWLLPGKYKNQSRVLRFTPFELIKKKWKDHYIYAPKNVDLFLSEMYGNWKIPDPFYYSILCENVICRTELTDSVSYNHIVRNLLQKDYKKTIIIIEKMLKFGSVNNTLINLKEKIKNVKK